MKCLVTGASGFIGGAACQTLVSQDHAVVRATSRVDDPNGLAEEATGCDVFVHAAGSSDERADSETLGWLNIAGTENALAAARRAGCERFVYVSCADVTLIASKRSFWDESRVPTQDPVGAVADTKLRAEELVRVGGSGPLHTLALRLSYVWGAGDRFHLPSWCNESQNGGLQLVGPGNHLFSTTHVDNAAAAIACACIADVPSGGVYYVADEELTLARDFFSEIAIALRGRAPRRGLPILLARARSALGLSPLSREEVLRRAYSTAFDCTQAKNQLGYRPVTTQQEGFAGLARWIREQGGAEAIVQRSQSHRAQGKA